MRISDWSSDVCSSDLERNLLAIRTVLEEVADVVVASSGEEALRQLLKGEFAVILLDVYMPGMDGSETAQIIRSREQRSEERRVGKECVITCRYRWSQYN